MYSKADEASKEVVGPMQSADFSGACNSGSIWKQRKFENNPEKMLIYCNEMHPAD